MPRGPKPTTVVDHYTLLRFDLSRLAEPPSRPNLPAPYRFATTMPRDDEERLLREGFPERLPTQHQYEWELPFSRQLPGLREDSMLAVLDRTHGVAIAFLVDVNECEQPGYAQGHYLCVDPRHRGRQLFNLIWQEALYRLDRWGLQGMFLTTDRRGHPRVYQRWGAELISVRPRVT